MVSCDPAAFDRVDLSPWGGGQFIHGVYCSYHPVTLGVVFRPKPASVSILRVRHGRNRYYVIPQECEHVISLAILNADVVVLGPFHTWDQALTAWAVAKG